MHDSKNFEFFRIKRVTQHNMFMNNRVWILVCTDACNQVPFAFANIRDPSAPSVRLFLKDTWGLPWKKEWNTKELEDNPVIQLIFSTWKVKLSLKRIKRCFKDMPQWNYKLRITGTGTMTRRSTEVYLFHDTGKSCVHVLVFKRLLSFPAMCYQRHKIYHRCINHRALGSPLKAFIFFSKLNIQCKACVPWKIFLWIP